MDAVRGDGRRLPHYRQPLRSNERANNAADGGKPVDSRYVDPEVTRARLAHLEQKTLYGRKRLNHMQRELAIDEQRRRQAIAARQADAFGLLAALEARSVMVARLPHAEEEARESVKCKARAGYIELANFKARIDVQLEAEWSTRRIRREEMMSRSVLAAQIDARTQLCHVELAASECRRRITGEQTAEIEALVERWINLRDCVSRYGREQLEMRQALLDERLEVESHLRSRHEEFLYRVADARVLVEEIEAEKCELIGIEQAARDELMYEESVDHSVVVGAMRADRDRALELAHVRAAERECLEQLEHDHRGDVEEAEVDAVADIYRARAASMDRIRHRIDANRYERAAFTDDAIECIGALAEREQVDLRSLFRAMAAEREAIAEWKRTWERRRERFLGAVKQRYDEIFAVEAAARNALKAREQEEEYIVELAAEELAQRVVELVEDETAARRSVADARWYGLADLQDTMITAHHELQSALQQWHAARTVAERDELAHRHSVVDAEAWRRTAILAAFEEGSDAIAASERDRFDQRQAALSTALQLLEHVDLEEAVAFNELLAREQAMRDLAQTKQFRRELLELGALEDDARVKVQRLEIAARQDLSELMAIDATVFVQEARMAFLREVESTLQDESTERITISREMASAFAALLWEVRTDATMAAKAAAGREHQERLELQEMLREDDRLLQLEAFDGMGSDEPAVDVVGRTSLSAYRTSTSGATSDEVAMMRGFLYAENLPEVDQCSAVQLAAVSAVLSELSSRQASAQDKLRAAEAAVAQSSKALARKKHSLQTAKEMRDRYAANRDRRRAEFNKLHDAHIQKLRQTRELAAKRQKIKTELEQSVRTHENTIQDHRIMIDRVHKSSVSNRQTTARPAHR